MCNCINSWDEYRLKELRTYDIADKQPLGNVLHGTMDKDWEQKNSLEVKVAGKGILKALVVAKRGYKPL